MKKLLSVFFISCGFLLASSASAEVIKNFDATYQVNADATINVTEKITYDFEDLERHGIFRNIPVRYKDRGGNYNLRINDIEVTDDRGNEYAYEVSNYRNYKQIKIGDADLYVTGTKIYTIKYRIDRAINYFDEHDELYWNVTGDEWGVSINKATARVVFPIGLAKDAIKLSCFSGPYGSDRACTYNRLKLNSSGLVESVEFANDNQYPFEGFSVLVGVPKAIIHEPGIVEKAWEILKDNYILALPFVVFLIMYNLWRNRGRDPEGRGTLIAEYDAPDNMGPAEVGTLMDETADNKDITSEIIKLATDGYLRVIKIKDDSFFSKGDYLLAKTDKAPVDANKVAKKLYDSLFKDKYIKNSRTDLKGQIKRDDNLKNEIFIGALSKLLGTNASGLSADNLSNKVDQTSFIAISGLSQSFFVDLEVVRATIYKSLVDNKYFPKSPTGVRTKYATIGIVVIVISLVLSGVINAYYGIFGNIACIFSGIIVLAFYKIMPARTKKGVLAREYSLGLKTYLNVAEKDRINFHNAPEKNPELFEKLLPYAMVFGVEKAWAKQFEDIYKQAPEWYSDPTGANFSSLVLADSLGSMGAKAGSTMSSKPSSSSTVASSGNSGFSSGGGFSGGGFGGGGGGSW